MPPASAGVYDFRSEDPFVERTVGFQHDDLGLVTQVTREPDADRSSGLQQVTDYTRSITDPYRRVQAITRSGTWVDDGDEVTQSRRTTLEYDDDVIFLKRTRSSVRCSPDGSACSELVTDVRFDPRDGTLLGVVDPAGVGTLLGYDSFGRLLREVSASGTTTVDYQTAQSLYSNGRLVPAKLKVSTKNSATGATSMVRLDSLGRTVQVSRSGLRQESLLQEFEFAWGNLLSYASRPHLPSDATQGAVTQDYDARWRLARRSFPDGTSVQLGSASVDNTSIASEGRELRVSSLRDQRGNTSYGFTDFRGNTLRKVDELGTATRYVYNPFSTLALIVDFQSNETRLRVDVLGRLVEHEDADTGLQAYRYTAFDQTLSMTDGDGPATRERRYRYDELGRLVTVQAPEGPTSFAYDEPGANAEGKLVEATSPSGATEHYEYEPRPADGDPMKNRGFVEQVSRHIDGTTFTTHFGYDPARNLLDRIDYPESGAGQPFSVRYSYDAFGNLESVKGTSEDGLSDAAPLWSLDAAYQGQAIAEETFGNGTTTAYAYEASTGRLKRLTTRDAADVVLQDINYTSYDGNGNLKARTTTLKRIAAAGTETINELFNYDALDRLDDYSANGAVTDLQYDELGNIQFKTGVGSYAYVEEGKAYRPHAVVGIRNGTHKVADYRYDDFGNLTHRSGDGVVGGSQDIVYTSFNKPATVTLGAPGSETSQVRYEYDAGQQRVLVAVGNCDSGGDGSCNKRIYVGGGYERQTTTDAGGPVTRHSYKVFAGTRQVAQVEREQRHGATVESRRFIHADHLGSSQLFTNAAGELTHAQRFDPFGAARVDATSDAASTRVRAGFTGHESDVETGLVNMGGRLYDSRIGRVLQADPPFMESPFWSQGLNRYSYVFNNPLNLVDPSGYDVNDPGTFEGIDEGDDGPGGDAVYQFGDDPLTAHGVSGWDDHSESVTCGGSEEAETSPSSEPDDGDEDAADYGESEALSQKSSSIPEIPGILDVFGGFGLGFAQGVVPGGTFLPTPPGSPSYELAVAMGQIVGGLQSIQNGTTLAGGGALASATGVGAPAGAPGVVVGVGLAAGGAINVIQGFDNIVHMVGPGGPSGNEKPPSVLQSGGNTIKPATAKALGLTQEQAKEAMHELKPFVGAPNDKVGKIMSNGDYVDKDTGEVLGNLYDFVK